MPTKSTSKPRQFSAPKRDWSVLTATEPKHVKRLEHIQETLDAAIEAIQEEGGIEDWEDFKSFVESFNKRPDKINESGNQKASISVDLVAEGKGDEISGFVFYLTKDPSHRTSGVYLVKNLKQAGVETKENNNYYTPSHVMDLIGLEASDELEDDELSEDLDDDLTDLEDDEELPKPNQAASKLSKSKSSSSRQNIKQSPKQEEDDIDQLLSDDEDTPITTGVLGKIAKNRHTQKSINNAEPQQSETKYPLLDSLETFLKETEHQGAIATTRGSEINGITVTGLTVQSATLMGLIGAKTVSDLIDYIKQAKDKEQANKLEDILEQIDSLNQRTDRVSVRVQQADVIADMKAIDDRTERLAERTKQVLEPPATTQPENLEIEERAKRNGSHHINADEIIIAPTQSSAVQIGEKIDNLGQKLDPKYKQSSPLQINKEANISEQLDQIQKYLGNLSKRLDRLETIVDELEQKITVNPSLEQTNSKTSVPQITTPNPAPIEDEPEDLLTKIVTQTKVQQQREAIADCLVNYAFASGQSPQSGIPFDDGGILYVTAEKNKVNLAINGSDGNEIFSGTKEGDDWKFAQDKLTPEEKETIFKLPQSEQEYDTLATAQALVDKFQNTFPKRFNGEKDPVFPWREPRREDGTPGAVKYEFEILDLPDGSQQLIGTDPRQSDAQVFDAILVKGKPPDIRECHISIEEMEALVGSPEKEKQHRRHNSPEQSKEDENELQA
jgi:DNA-binding ferritin-like protein